jgi:hypothetical protein
MRRPTWPGAGGRTDESVHEALEHWLSNSAEAAATMSLVGLVFMQSHIDYILNNDSRNQNFSLTVQMMLSQPLGGFTIMLPILKRGLFELKTGIGSASLCTVFQWMSEDSPSQTVACTELTQKRNKPS